MLYTGKLLYAELYDDMTPPYTDVRAVWEAHHAEHTGHCIVTNGHWWDAGPKQCGNYKAGGRVLSRQYGEPFTGLGWSGDGLPEWVTSMDGVDNFVSTVPALIGGKVQDLDKYDAGVKRAAERTWLGRTAAGEWYIEVTTDSYTLEGIVDRMEQLGIVDGMVLDGSGSSQWYDGETHITGDGRTIYNYVLLWFEAKPKEDGKVEVIDVGLKFNGTLYKRSETDYIILHHEAGNGSVEDVHNYHLSKGWKGIAYHYFVRKDGTIYRGRPEDTSGGHTTGYNHNSIGICAEGNFELEAMSDAQRDALHALVLDVRTRYPDTQTVRHRDLAATACPGKNYPFDFIAKEGENVTNPVYVNRDDVKEQAPWGLATFDKLVKMGYLEGEAEDVYNISREMLRILVILDRAGQFD